MLGDLKWDAGGPDFLMWPPGTQHDGVAFLRPDNA